MDYAEVMAALGGALLVVGIIGLVVLVLSIIANWKIYEKAGEAGWKCLIPYYATFVEYNFTWNKTFAIVAVALMAASSVVGLLGLPAIIASIISLANFVLSIIESVKLSKAFGHGVGFAVGLIFLPFIFRLILAFGDSQYVGPQE